MYIVGVLSFRERTIDEVPEIEQALDQMGYAVHMEPMGTNTPEPKIGDYYYEEGAIILWLCRCFGDAERCRVGVRGFVEAGVDVIVAMGPGAVEIALPAAQEAGIPLLFTHLTRDEPTASEMEALRHLGTVSGVWNPGPRFARERLGLITELVPPPDTVHAVYNPEVSAARFEAGMLRRAAQELGLKLVLHEARSSAQAMEEVTGLQADPDHALIRLADPTTDQAAGLMGAVAHERDIPYVGLTHDEMERAGALFALEARGAGRLAAGMIARVLKGESLAYIPLAEAPRTSLGVNLQAAQDLGLIVSPAVLSRAEVTLPAVESTRLEVQFIGLLMLTLLAILVVAAVGSWLHFPYLLAIILGSTLVLFPWMFLYLNRRIITPIRKLAITAEKIGSGDLNTPIADLKANREVDILTRALRRMRSNLKSSYSSLNQVNQSLKEQVDELTQAYRDLQAAQQELELASRRIIAADDNQRFALTTYIHDEIIRPLDEIDAIARETGREDLLQLSEDLEQRMRQLRFELSVPILKDIGLEIRRLAQETLPRLHPEASSIARELDLAALDRCRTLEPASVFLAYRFARGAISNVYRHSDASRMHVAASVHGGQLRLSVDDDGKGFDPSQVEALIRSGHYFFHDIRIRTMQLNGDFLVRSAPGAGTHLEISLPLGHTARRPKRVPMARRSQRL